MNICRDCRPQWPGRLVIAGVISGIYASLRAIRLDPIAALRYE